MTVGPAVELSSHVNEHSRQARSHRGSGPATRFSGYGQRFQEKK